MFVWSLAFMESKMCSVHLFKPSCRYQNADTTLMICNTKRNYQTDAKRTRLPMLMDFPQMVWPTPTNLMKSWININFCIQPYLERSFDMRQFTNTSKCVVQLISNALREQDFNSIHLLVERGALEKLQFVVSKMSEPQLNLLPVQHEDIFYAFPHQVRVVENAMRQRQAEITMCYFVMLGSRRIMKSGFVPPFLFWEKMGFDQQFYVLNYRFVREFARDAERQWMVNIVNHFQPYAN